jgi:hypothetical protein
MGVWYNSASMTISRVEPKEFVEQSAPVLSPTDLIQNHPGLKLGPRSEASVQPPKLS